MLHKSTGLLAAIRLAALLLFCVGITSTASAVTIWKVNEGDGHYSLVYVDDEGDVKSIHFYGPDDEYFGSKYFDSNPNPEGDDGGGTLGPDAVAQLLELLKKYGGAVAYEENLWNRLMNHSGSFEGKGPAVIDPAPYLDTLAEDGWDGGGGGGGFDPGVPIGEQIDKLIRKGSDDDDDGDDGKNPPPEEFNPDPTVIDPPPFILHYNDVDVDGNGVMLLELYGDGTAFFATYRNADLVALEAL